MTPAIDAAAAANRVSALGSVINATNHRSLGPDFSLIGSPLPTYALDLSTAGLAPTGLNEIYYYHAGVQDKMIRQSNTWLNAVPGGKVFGLYPGAGHQPGAAGRRRATGFVGR